MHCSYEKLNSWLFHLLILSAGHAVISELCWWLRGSDERKAAGRGRGGGSHWCPVECYVVRYCWQVKKDLAPMMEEKGWRQKIKKERKKKTREGKKRTAVLMPQWHLVLLVRERQWGHVMDGGRQGEARHVVVKPLGWDVGSLSTHRKGLGFYLKAYIKWRKLNTWELFDISGKL